MLGALSILSCLILEGDLEAWPMVLIIQVKKQGAKRFDSFFQFHSKQNTRWQNLDMNLDVGLKDYRKNQSVCSFSTVFHTANAECFWQQMCVGSFLTCQQFSASLQQTPARCRLTQLGSDAIYLEVVAAPMGGALSHTRLSRPPPSEAIWEHRWWPVSLLLWCWFVC